MTAFLAADNERLISAVDAAATPAELTAAVAAAFT